MVYIVDEFDVHILVSTTFVEGDTWTRCEVTYQSLRDQPDIKINYESEHSVESALKDIAAYMNGPKTWVEEYIKHSPEDWRRLRATQEAIEECRKRIEDWQKYIAHDQASLTQLEAEIIALQAKLGHT